MLFLEKNKGFTLIELMVSISIFALVMVICMGSILSVLDASRKSASFRSVVDNLNTTLEAMTRTIRFGQYYHCGTSGDTTKPQDCASGDSTFTVLSEFGDEVTYELSNGQIARSVNGAALEYLTSPDVTIQSLTFTVLGSCPYSDSTCTASPPDTLQPRVIVVLRGIVTGTNQTGSSFNLETTITQRKIDSQ